MDKYICTVCDWVYDPEIGDPEHGIAPGTKFEDIPDDWVCPLCGVGKEDFEKIMEIIEKFFYANSNNRAVRSFCRLFMAAAKPHFRTMVFPWAPAWKTWARACAA